MKRQGRSPAQTYRFGEFELDAGQLLLRRGDRALDLQARPLRLLLYLIENRGRCLPKRELLQWWGAAVSDTAVSSALKEIRRALGDDASAPRWIRTRRGVGYQFVGAVLAADPLLAPEPHGGLHGAPRGLSMSFVGRARELAQLEALLTRETHVAVHACVEGLAGVGKTELALQLVHKLAHERRFPGGICWLDAEQPDLRPLWGTRLADAFEIRPGSVEERCRELLRRLAAAREPVLVVLDNASDWSSRARPQPLPEGAHVRVLVTTRARNLGGPQFSHLELGLLLPPHDRELLLQLAGRPLGAGLEELLAQLSGHTLGLELAGVFLGTHRGCDAQTYLGELCRDAQAVEAGVSERVRYEHTVTEAFRLVWDRMPEPAREAWRTAACFEPVPATRGLAAAAGLGEAGLRALEECHLVQFAADGRWSMHRLARAFGQQAGSAAEQLAARRRFARGCAERARQIRARGLQLYLDDRAHFHASLELAPSALEPADELALLLGVGPPLMFHGGFAAAQVAAVYERAAKLAEQTERAAELFVALELAWLAAMVQGEWAACAALSERMQQHCARQRDPRYALSLQILLGIRELYCGSLARAAELLEACLQSVRSGDASRLGTVPVGSLLSHTALARALRGLPEQALPLADEALRHAQASSDPAGAAMAHGWWGCLLHQVRGDAPQVERCAALALELARSHGLSLYEHFGIIFSGWARIAQAPEAHASALAEMTRALERLGSLQLGIARAYATGLVAEACARCGERARGQALIASALALLEHSGERFCEPELWRIHAALSAEPAEQLRALERSFELALERHALAWAQKALADWTALPGAGARAELAALRLTEHRAALAREDAASATAAQR